MSGSSSDGGLGGEAQAGSGGDSVAGADGVPSGGGAGGVADGGEAGASPDPNDVTAVIRSAGCGQAATQTTGEFVKYTITTSGTKDSDATGGPKGDWSFERDYYVWLPPDYDENTAYPLVIQGPGCGGIGTDVYSLSPHDNGLGEGVNGTVIRVGLTPPPDEINHVEALDQGCFDDKEGDDSVEWPFYEAVMDLSLIHI